MGNLAKTENVSSASQGRTEAEQYQYLLSNYDQVMDILERSERNKQVTNYIVLMTKDGVTGFEICISNKGHLTKAFPEVLESVGFYPCGLSDLGDIANYVNYWQYNQCFEMLKAWLKVVDNSITLDGALELKNSSISK